jgi:hypothetical protein
MLRKGELEKVQGIRGDKTGLRGMGWAELHWYEAAGIGKRGMKIKRFL